MPLKRDAGAGQDFALVEIPPQHRDWVFPTLGVVGGPCGVFTGTAPQPVAHYGPARWSAPAGLRARAWAPRPRPRPVRTPLPESPPAIMPARTIESESQSQSTPSTWMNVTHGIGITGAEPSALAWGYAREHDHERRVAAGGQPATVSAVLKRLGIGRLPRVRRLSGLREAPEIADLGAEADRCQGVDAAQTAQPPDLARPRRRRDLGGDLALELALRWISASTAPR